MRCLLNYHVSAHSMMLPSPLVREASFLSLQSAESAEAQNSLKARRIHKNGTWVEPLSKLRRHGGRRGGKKVRNRTGDTGLQACCDCDTLNPQ